MGIVILSRKLVLPSTNVGEMSTVEFSTAVIYFARSEEFNDDRMQKYLFKSSNESFPQSQLCAIRQSTICQ